MTMFPAKSAASPKAAIHVEPKRATPLGDTCFIESQFPVSKMSKESYAERKGVQSQTLTGLGKWWGRKPLVLCRATILGLLLPATDDPQMDREVFLRLMTMEDDGMLRRKSANIPAKELFRRLPPSERTEWFEKGSTEDTAKLKRGLDKEDKEELQRRVFLSMSYDERLEYCDRPEQIEGPSPASWKIINAHLGTAASTIPELVAELGKRRFGHVPRVGDSFCGGGSIPFEAARIGCEAYGSDLNPVAALLTWAALNIVGGGAEVANKVQDAQRRVYEAVDRQVTEWGIEHREPDPKTGRRWRADAYLYCTEITCPECGWRVPLSPSWFIGPGSRTIASLVENRKSQSFDIVIKSSASPTECKAAAESGTISGTDLVCPHCAQSSPDRCRTPIRAIRGDGRGTFGEQKSWLRAWTKTDVAPTDTDVFRERLFCIRWIDSWIGEDGKEHTARIFASPTKHDIDNEALVHTLLNDRLSSWQASGFVPGRRIETGYNTDQPIRERGWTHWHHLFTPRQLLLHGLLLEKASAILNTKTELVACMLGVGRCSNWNSRLCMWGAGAARESFAQTFSNQALNTLWNYGSKALGLVSGAWFLPSDGVRLGGRGVVHLCDARSPALPTNDLWVTDPPYADAVNYDEVSEFFLAWHDEGLKQHFPEWYRDSKRAMAVRGDGASFSQSMIECYQHLAGRTSEGGFQVVMFTHQNASVWADLAMILWASGLSVSAAWCIATETNSALKEGNYVQGTVLLILRKQTSTDTAFLDEVYQEVEGEVRRQLDSMKDLDDSRDPNFSDTDYQLAAYAAALRVLTSKKIEEIDVAYELTRKRGKGEKSKVEEIIEKAVKIACDHLVPVGIEPHLWKSLSSLERLYVKGLEMESHGEHRQGVYQELARGFGVEEYKQLLASTKANETRLKTATEFGRKELGDAGFGSSLVRHALFATFKTAETDSTRDGITWFKTEVKDYAANRQRLIDLLDYMAALGKNASLEHWHKDAHAAGLLAGALRNRQDNV